MPKIVDNMQLEWEMFPSETSFTRAAKKCNNYEGESHERWRSYYEFIAFCIGKHSTLAIYVYFKHLNIFQDFAIYILVGIPVCYVQLILGQYTNVGIFLIRRMLPLIQGVSYVYFIIIFMLTVIIVSEMEANVIYLLLSFDPSKTVWNMCPPKYYNICWDFQSVCTEENPCVNANIRLPTYLFWNYTFMGGTYPIETSQLGWPDSRLIWVTVLSWFLIYVLTIVSFARVKRTIQLLVTISVFFKITFLVKFGLAIGFNNIMAQFLKIEHETWFDRKSWEVSISRVVSSMMLGDFTYIMFGVYTTYSEHTGTMAFIGAISGYGILLIEIIITKSAVYVLSAYSKINSADYHYFFVPHAPASLIIVPAALGIMKESTLWVSLYFLTNILSYLVWSIINITCMQQSLYQRFTGMQSYYKYICPAFCLLGFTIGIFNQTKQIYEVRFDATMVVDSFCQHVNLIILTFMVVNIYGFRRLSDDIQFMTGKQPSNFWKVTWVVAPIIMMLSIPYHYLSRKHPFFGFRIFLITLTFSPLFILGGMFIMNRLYHKDILGILRSDPLWGPKDPHLRMLRNDFQPRKQTKYKRYDAQCPHKCLLSHKAFFRVKNEENNYEINTLQLKHFEKHEFEKELDTDIKLLDEDREPTSKLYKSELHPTLNQ